MFILMYLGAFFLFEESFNLIRAKTWENVDGEIIATDRLRLDTICFHVFILMNLFN